MNGKVNSEFDLLGNFIENSQEQIISEILNQKTTSILQKVKNFFKRHFVVGVIGYSMSGVLEHGDIVGAKKATRFTRYNKGDIIVFKMHDMKIIHQIVGTRIVNGEVQYITKGVYNQEIDSRTVSKRDIIGKVDISKSDLNRLITQISEGKTTIMEVFGMTEEIEGILSVGERIHTKEGKVLYRLKQFLAEHTQFDEKLNNYIAKFNHLVDNNGKISRKDCKLILKEIVVHYNEIGSTETYKNLINAMTKCNPYFWLELSDSEIKYIENYEPIFEFYYNEYIVEQTRRASQKGGYDINFHKPFVKQQQDTILKKQWGGRDAMFGEPIFNQPITRHHLRYGRDLNNKNLKADCRISALVPVITDPNHDPSGDPHTPDWRKRFEDAKIYIEQGLAYIPAWWKTEYRIDYKKYLTDNGIPYVVGKVK